MTSCKPCISRDTEWNKPALIPIFLDFGTWKPIFPILMENQNSAIFSLAADVINLRKDILQLSASNIALTETVLQLSVAWMGQDRKQLLEGIIKLTQKYHQNLLAGIEDVSPGLASILDDRSEDEVDGATS